MSDLPEMRGRGRPAKRPADARIYSMTLRVPGDVRRALRRLADNETDRRGRVVSLHDLILEAVNALLRECPEPKALADARQMLEDVAEHYGVTVDVLTGNSRGSLAVAARQCAMHRLRGMGLSYPEIARVTGRGDHTTAIHGVRAHEKRMAWLRA